MKAKISLILISSIICMNQTVFADDCVDNLAMQGEDWSAMFFSGMDFRDGTFCEPEDESAEIYSDTMIMLSWRHCVGSYGDSKTRRLLGYNDSWRDQGHELYPFTKIRKKRVARNRSAKRVAEWAGNFRFVGNKSAAILALSGYADMAVGASKRARGPISDNNGNIIEGAMDNRNQLMAELANMQNNYGSIISQLNGIKAHPTKVLSIQAIDNMMDRCGVDAKTQEEYREIAGTLSGMSSYLSNFEYAD